MALGALSVDATADESSNDARPPHAAAARAEGSQAAAEAEARRR
jgi:hypothetical protein